MRPALGYPAICVGIPASLAGDCITIVQDSATLRIMRSASAFLFSLIAVVLCSVSTAAWSDVYDVTLIPRSPYPLLDDRPADCPPCFNCQLDSYNCTHFAPCNKYNGKCSCPPGFGGDDCSTPVCGALADGENRPRREGDTCSCKDGCESPRVSYFDDWKLASLGSQDVTDTRSFLFFLQETQARCAIFGRRDDLCQTVRQFLKGW